MDSNKEVDLLTGLGEDYFNNGLTPKEEAALARFKDGYEKLEREGKLTDEKREFLLKRMEDRGLPKNVLVEARKMLYKEEPLNSENGVSDEGSSLDTPTGIRGVFRSKSAVNTGIVDADGKATWCKVKEVVVFILLLPFRLLNICLRSIHTVLIALLILLLVGGVVGCVVYGKVRPMYEEASAQAYEKLSTLNTESFQKLENTTVFDCKGKVIGSVDAGDYHYAKIQDISQYVQQGYIAQEDKRFMEHCGIDLKALSRAGLALVVNRGEITQGGSTLTQQVIKNCLLTQEQTYSRKLVEVLLAPKIEQEFSKADIMEFYCNTAYYGNLCYGVDTASRYYFGKKANELSLGESAMLCGVSNSPNNYNPVASMKLAKEKRDQVLDNMVKCGFITHKQADSAKRKEIKLKVEDDAQQSDNYMVSYAVHCTALELMKQSGFEFKYVFEDLKEQTAYKKKYSQVYKEKSSLVRSGGYKIYTSFDMTLQNKLQKAIDKGLKKYKQKQSNGKYALQGAGVCIDNETGFVVALVGGRGRKDEYNRAFLSMRQPGSTIKPLLDYAPAINEGVKNPSSIMVDKPVYAIEGDISSYSPKNSGGGYRGEMKLRDALAFSINTIAYQTYKAVGSERAIGYLNQMHFSSLSFADNSAEALALGGFTNGCTVSDMARGYNTLAMSGQYTTRTCLTRVDFQGGKKVYVAPELEKSTSQVFTQDTAFMVTDMLQGTFEKDGATAHAYKDKRIIQAGKTGTTSSNKDAWFCGYTRFYTTSIWVGYDKPKQMAGMYGGTVPASIWSSYMRGISKNMDAVDFDKPETVSLRRIFNGDYSGDDLTVKDTVRTYKQRKGGTEWFSEQNRTKYSKNDNETALQDSINKAKKAVKEFIEWTIGNAEDAQNLDQKYAQVLKVIDGIGDEYKELSYKERAADHYELLAGEVRTVWLQQIKELNRDKAEEAEHNAKLAAEDSLHNAKLTLKEGRIAKVEWYLETIAGRSYYTDVTKMLIADLRVAVERLKGYSEYSSYKSRMKSTIAEAKRKPKQPEMPDIPEDEMDGRDPSMDDYPDEDFY